MKKIIIATLLCLSSLPFVAAQEPEGNEAPFVNKQNISYFPKAGDFALGVDATPFLDYLGNLFSQNGGNQAPEFESELGIYGKYFIEDNRAIRAKLLLDFSKESYKQTVPNDHELLVNPTNTNATVVDTKNQVNNGIFLNIGYEFRRGKGRLQGFYGADLLLGYGNVKYTYKYGNPITAANQSPSTADFYSSHFRNGDRVLEQKTGYAFTAGVGAFVGVEYFIAPLVSLGGEFNLNFLYETTGQSEITRERFMGTGVQEYNVRERLPNDEAFRTGLFTRPTGSLFVMFYF
ncbi:MAG: outer membrane beta-barrel protein [Dysgonamonadaceae bacterium]|jgi:hypothetical protein|nr:outer membrane beta-barrel protein [Dysgonamonadaceae bacterium]